MAKTIMISNEVYDELKAIKENKSFTEVIVDLIERKDSKTVGNLIKNHFGALKGDKEYGRAMKRAKNGWAKWTKEYA